MSFVFLTSPPPPSNPVPLPDLYFDSLSYPVASTVFGDMAIVSLFLLLFFKPIPDPVCNLTARFLCSGFYYGDISGIQK